MVKAGARASVLESLLRRRGQLPDAKPKAPRLEDLEPQLRQGILDLYRALGGELESPLLRPGAWDLSCGGVLIELDEELHFNRYRETTLRPAWAAALPWTPTYINYCQIHETDCLRAATWGKRWTSESSARMLGTGSAPGDLSSAGAPRWKQRALYDAIKDAIAAQDDGRKVARLSIHDELSEGTLGAALEGGDSIDADELLSLLASRTS